MAGVPPEEMFQFLIGAIETKTMGIKLKNNIGFQFLIGAIETGIERVVQSRALQFQFLIGTIETKRRGNRLHCGLCVSIPYRCDYGASASPTYIAQRRLNASPLQRECRA